MRDFLQPFMTSGSSSLFAVLAVLAWSVWRYVHDVLTVDRDNLDTGVTWSNSYHDWLSSSLLIIAAIGLACLLIGVWKYVAAAADARFSVPQMISASVTASLIWLLSYTFSVLRREYSRDYRIAPFDLSLLLGLLGGTISMANIVVATHVHAIQRGERAGGDSSGPVMCEV